MTTRIYSLHQPVTSSLRGVSAPAGTLCVTPTAGFTSVPIYFFSLHQVPVCWSKAARFTTNPLCEHSYCKPIVCQVGSDTHTSRLHNHALFHCHNTLDWFIIVQLPLQSISISILMFASIAIHLWLINCYFMPCHCLMQCSGRMHPTAGTLGCWLSNRCSQVDGVEIEPIDISEHLSRSPSQTLLWASMLIKEP